MPSKSEPRPTWSMPATLRMCSMWSATCGERRLRAPGWPRPRRPCAAVTAAGVAWAGAFSRARLGRRGCMCRRGLGGDEAGHEVDHHDAAVLSSARQHVVGHVARHVADRARRRVREDHRRLADAQRVAHRVRRDVARGRPACPRRFISRTTSSPNGDSPPLRGVVGRRVGPRQRVVVRQRHVADAERAQNCRSAPSELSIEWPPSMPIIEAIRPALAMRSTSSAVRGQLEHVGVAAQHLVDACRSARASR